MLPLTTVVAIAVSLSVLFIVCSVVGTIVWIRIRQEKLSMAVANARTGRYARGLQNFPAETVTELSPEEGTALGQYGQLPYGNPTEWALMESRERLIKPSADPETSSQFTEKARSLRHSLSRSKSKRGLRRPPRLSSLAPVGEKDAKNLLDKPFPELRTSSSRDDVAVSAVEGVMELPAETSPRQSPDKEPPGRSTEDLNLHSMAGAWSALMQRDHSSSLFPVREDDYEAFDPYRLRLRGGSITAQSAGTMPDQPVPPPPPCAYPPNRFRLSRNESSMRLSSLSLDTADSSILEDGRRTPMVTDSNFNSPALPPCPTFAPFSANDVGRVDRSFSTSKGSLQGSFAFPSGSLEWEGHRLERDRASPRRSMTARSPSHSMERISIPLRRSESVSANPPRKDPPFTSLGNTPVLYPSANNIPAHWNGINYNSALLPHFSQMRRPSTHNSFRQKSCDSFFGSTDRLVSVPEGPGRKATSFFVHETPLSADGRPRPPPPSVLKGGNGPRKGHRRQNCVRISIHPPITFGGPVFSPMAEEPEEGERPGGQRPEISEFSTSNISSLPSVSTISMDRHSYSDTGRPPSYRRASYRGSSKKQKPTRAQSVDATNGKYLSGINTAVPTRTVSLSRTPSPDKSPPILAFPNNVPSPTAHENQPGSGGQRISAVKGPRSQPGKPARNSTQRSSMPLAENNAASPPSTSPTRRPNSANRESQKSPPVLQRGNSNSTDRTLSTNDRDAAEGLQVVSGPQPVSRPLSPSCGVNKTSSTRSGNIVTIWEDTKLERTPTKQSSTSCPEDPVELQGDIVFGNGIERHKSTGAIKSDENNNTITTNTKDENNNETNDIKKSSRATSERSHKPELMTPVKKTVGLGIGAAAPSLYDGDGFLKE